jgi:hypothetical protein
LEGSTAEATLCAVWLGRQSFQYSCFYEEWAPSRFGELSSGIRKSGSRAKLHCLEGFHCLLPFCVYMCSEAVVCKGGMQSMSAIMIVVLLSQLTRKQRQRTWASTLPGMNQPCALWAMTTTRASTMLLLIFGFWQHSCTCNAWQFSPYGQSFCRSGATKVLGEGHLANVWIFLLSHPQQGGMPPLGR